MLCSDDIRRFPKDDRESLLLTVEALRARLAETGEALRAALAGGLDAFLIFRSARDEAGRIADFIVTEINARGERLLSRPKADVVGRSLCDLLPVDRSGPLFGKCVRVVETGAELEEEFSLSAPGMEARWLHHRVVPLGDGMAMTLRDVTGRRHAEAALKESEDRFRTLMAISSAGFFIVQGGCVVFMSPAQETLFGPIRAVSDLRRLEEVHPDDAARFGTLCDAMAEESPEDREADFRLLARVPRGGAREMRWIHGRVSPIPYRDGRATLVAMIDITRAKELEHRALVQEKMASLGHVAAGIAHEIRNPLSGLNIYRDSLVKLLEESAGLEPENREMARVIGDLMRSASGKIEGVIRRVMDFAKPNPPTVGLIDLNECALEAVQLAKETVWKHGGARIRTSLRHSLPPCYADSHLIRRVLLSLITNASQAMEGFEGRKEIEVATRIEDRHIVIAVSDSGPGVPDADRARIFDPFYTTRSDGSGIGLSFSHRVVTDHGGFLSVGRSRLGGAEFRVGLPLERKT